MLLENERLDYLLKENLRIIQNDNVFSFSRMRVPVTLPM